MFQLGTTVTKSNPTFRGYTLIASLDNYNFMLIGVYATHIFLIISPAT